MSWESNPLPDIVFFQEGPGLRNWQWTDGGMKVINVKNILGDGVGSVDTTNSDRYISFTEFESKYKHFEVQENDIVVASSGNTYGKVGRIEQYNLPLMMNTSVIRFRSKDEVLLNSEFLYCFLRSPIFKNQIEQFVTGGAQPNFGPTHVKKMVIPVPPISLQESIGEFIAQYDQLLTNNKRRIELLEESGRQLYKEWFVRFRFPGHEHVKINDGVPEGWNRWTLNEVLTLNYGKALKAETRIAGDIPVYGSSGEVGKHNKALVKGPGIVVGRKGNVGSIFWVHSDFFPIDTAYFVSAEESDYYIYYALLHTTFINTDVAVPGLNRDMAYSREILLPGENLRQKFLDEVTPIFEQCNVLSKYSNQLASARDLLLPKLMNGEITV